MASLKIVCPDAAVASVSDLGEIPSYTLSKDVFVLKAVFSDAHSSYQPSTYRWSVTDGLCASEGVLDNSHNEGLDWHEIAGNCTRFLIVKKEKKVRRFYKVEATDAQDNELQGLAIVTVKTAKASLSGTNTDLKCGQLATLCATVTSSCEQLFDASGNVLPNIDITYVFSKDGCEFLESHEKCVDVSEAGVYSLSVCICYEDYCVIEQIDATQTVEVTGKYADASSCLPCPPPVTPINKVELCFDDDNNTAGSAVLAVLYQNAAASDSIVVLLGDNNLVLDPSADLLDGPHFDNTYQRWTFKPKYAGNYRVAASRTVSGVSKRPVYSNILTVYYDNGSQVNQMHIDFGFGIEPQQAAASDCGDTDTRVTYYCIPLNILCELSKKDTEHHLHLLNSDGSPLVPVDNAAGYVLYDENGEKISEGLLRDADSDDDSDDADIEFNHFFGLEDRHHHHHCEDLEDLYGVYKLFVYNSNGDVLVENVFELLRPLEEVELEVDENQMSCDTINTLTATTVGGTDNLVYVWKHNGSVIAGETSSQLQLDFKDDAGLYTVSVTDLGLSQDGLESLCASGPVESNAVTLFKKFSVHIKNNNGDDKSVDINSGINLTAEVDGINEEDPNCKIIYQWFLKDCRCNYIEDLSGNRCLLGSSKTLEIDPSQYENMLFASNYICVMASNTSLETITDSNNCTKNTIKQVWGQDSIKTSQTVALSVKNSLGFNCDNTNLFRIFDNSEIVLTPKADTQGYNVKDAASAAWYFVDADGSENLIGGVDNGYGYEDASHNLHLDRCDEAGTYRFKATWQNKNQCLASGEVDCEIIKDCSVLDLTITPLAGTEYVKSADCSDNEAVDANGVEIEDLGSEYEIELKGLNGKIPDGVAFVVYWELFGKDASGNYTIPLDGVSEISGNIYNPEYVRAYCCKLGKFTIKLRNDLQFQSCDLTAKLVATVYAIENITPEYYECFGTETGCLIGVCEVSQIITQRLAVSFNAQNACDSDDVQEDVFNVELDPSGLIIEAIVCGNFQANEVGGQYFASNMPIVYQWFDADGNAITPETTFNKLAVNEVGTYKVVAKQNVGRLNGVSPLGEFGAWVIQGTATITVSNPQQPLEAVSVKPTSRSVVAFNSSGALLDKSSNLGLLKAYVSPEQEDLHFQWFFNDAPINNANGRTYNPGKVAGSYTVKVSNSLGHVASKPFNINLKK